jgi:Zn finger protein HypA/HybF involved in hydrogenase expression
MSESNSPVSLTKEEYLDHTEAYDGLCLSCHSWTDGGVEPDAEHYTCEDCGAPDAVVGTEQAMLLGKIEIVGVDNE